MSDEAIAILCSVDVDTGECSADVFREADYPDPLLIAHGLRDSCEADFPNRMWALNGNERAGEIQTKRRMKAMGFDG